MWKSCSKCGRIHDTRFKCKANSLPSKATERTEQDKIRSQARWQRKRDQVRKDSLQMCAVCKAEGRYVYDGVEIHHITKVVDAPELAFDDYNLVALCQVHHKAADKGEMDDDYLRKLARERVKQTPPHF